MMSDSGNTDMARVTSSEDDDDALSSLCVTPE
jgi:hypothetical protein